MAFVNFTQAYVCLNEIESKFALGNIQDYAIVMEICGIHENYLWEAAALIAPARSPDA